MLKRLSVLLVAVILSGCGGSESSDGAFVRRTRNAVPCDQDALTALRSRLGALLADIHLLQSEVNDFIPMLVVQRLTVDENNQEILVDDPELEAEARAWNSRDEANRRLLEKSIREADDLRREIDAAWETCQTTTNTEPSGSHVLRVEFDPPRPSVGDYVWVRTSSDCELGPTYHSVRSARHELYMGHPNHQPLRVSQPETYDVTVTGTCMNGDEVRAEVPLVVTGVDRPSHDDFSLAREMRGESGTASGVSTGSTWETNETAHSNCTWESDTSVWHTWTAPAAGTLDLVMNEAWPVYLLTAMTGSSISGLSPAESSWYGRWEGQHVTVERGVRYHILVSGCYRDGFGSYRFSWTFTPRDASSPTTSPEQSAAIATFAVSRENVTQTADPGVVELSVPEESRQIVLDDTFRAVVDELTGGTARTVYVSVGNGPRVPLAEGENVIDLVGDAEDVIVSVDSPGAASRDLKINLVRTPADKLPAVDDGGTGSRDTGTVVIVVMIVTAGLVLFLLWRRRRRATD